jgi:import inner membrane translocase subunit TIM22
MGETKPTRVVLRETWVLMKEKSKSYAKGFGGMGFLYSGTECMIEKYRAKHDKWNATLAGCATGGMMAVQGRRWTGGAAVYVQEPKRSCMSWVGM